MSSTHEKDKVDSKRMHVDAMTQKGEVSFAEEYKNLLDICDEIGTKGDKKHAKREAKACSKKNTIGYIKDKTYFAMV